MLGLLPILLLFIFPLISNLFSGSEHSATPRMMFDESEPPFTLRRMTPNLNIAYFVNPVDVQDWTKYKLTQLDRTAEVNRVRGLRVECENEMMHKRRLVDAAQGWFRPDPEKMDEAKRFKMPSCQRLDNLGVSR